MCEWQSMMPGRECLPPGVDDDRALGNRHVLADADDLALLDQQRRPFDLAGRAAGPDGVERGRGGELHGSRARGRFVLLHRPDGKRDAWLLRRMRGADGGDDEPVGQPLPTTCRSPWRPRRTRSPRATGGGCRYHWRPPGPRPLRRRAGDALGAGRHRRQPGDRAARRHLRGLRSVARRGRAPARRRADDGPVTCGSPTCCTPPPPARTSARCRCASAAGTAGRADVAGPALAGRSGLPRRGPRTGVEAATAQGLPGRARPVREDSPYPEERRGRREPCRGVATGRGAARPPDEKKDAPAAGYGRAKLTNPDKVLYPRTGTSERATCSRTTWAVAARWMLPHLADQCRDDGALAGRGWRRARSSRRTSPGTPRTGCARRGVGHAGRGRLGVGPGLPRAGQRGGPGLGGEPGRARAARAAVAGLGPRDGRHPRTWWCTTWTPVRAPEGRGLLPGRGGVPGRRCSTGTGCGRLAAHVRGQGAAALRAGERHEGRADAGVAHEVAEPAGPPSTRSTRSVLVMAKARRRGRVFVDWGRRTTRRRPRSPATRCAAASARPSRRRSPGTRCAPAANRRTSRSPSTTSRSGWSATAT